MKLLKNYQVELAPTLSGHWYNVWQIDKRGRKKFLGTFPSATTILNAYPQSPHLTRWIAEHGWHESQQIKSEAGEQGTKVHAACDLLEEGIELSQTNYSLEEWKKTWMSNVGKNNALFISATNKENFEEFKEIVYEAVREIHITRFPYNKFLYPDYKDAVED